MSAQKRQSKKSNVIFGNKTKHYSGLVVDDKKFNNTTYNIGDEQKVGTLHLIELKDIEVLDHK